MKKLMVLIFSTLFATPVFAYVVIQLQNVPASDKVFINSTAVSKKIYAVNLGDIAVIPNSALSSYPANTTFALGLETKTMDMYCVTSTINPTQQFFFNYLKVSPNKLNISLVEPQDICVGTSL